MIFYGEIQGGKIQLDHDDQFQNFVKKNEGKKIKLSLTKRSKNRSNDQNSYYWGVVINMISEYIGDEAEAVHDYMRMQFLIVDTPTIKKLQSTSELSTVEFEDYLSKIRKWAQEYLNLIIPLPNEAPIPEEFIYHN